MGRQQSKQQEKLTKSVITLVIINIVFLAIAKFIQGDFNFARVIIIVNIFGMITLVTLWIVQLVAVLCKKQWAMGFCVFGQCVLIAFLIFDVTYNAGGNVATMERDIKILAWIWLAIAIVGLIAMGGLKYIWENMREHEK